MGDPDYHKGTGQKTCIHLRCRKDRHKEIISSSRNYFPVGLQKLKEVPGRRSTCPSQGGCGACSEEAPASSQLVTAGYQTPPTHSGTQASPSPTGSSPGPNCGAKNIPKHTPPCPLVFSFQKPRRGSSHVPKVLEKSPDLGSLLQLHLESAGLRNASPCPVPAVKS